MAPPLTLNPPQLHYSEVLLSNLTDAMESLLAKGAVEVTPQDVLTPGVPFSDFLGPKEIIN